MPWPVYTERLMQVSEVNTWRSYHVKTGKRLILKTCVATNTDPVTPLQVHVLLNGFYVAAFFIRDAYAAQSLELMNVGYEGEEMRVYLQGVSGWAVLTGWVLADPDGPPAVSDEITPLPSWPDPPAWILDKP